MKIEDQVLSIEQVVKLQNLGFDVIKNSSAIVIIKENDTFIVSKKMVEKNIFGITDKIEDMFYTMTIGDIIDVLPNRIYANDFYFLTISDGVVKYHSEVFSNKGMFRGFGLTIKDGLFEALKWCIQEKHIEL